MEMNDKHIEERNELFDSAVREQMTGFEPQVPHALWNRISSELDKGEASDESRTVIPQYHEKSTYNRWRLGIAAAVLLTLSVGTLLYTQVSHDDKNSSPASIADKTQKASVSPSASTAPVQISDTKVVAQSAPIVTKAISGSKDIEMKKATPSAIPAIEMTLENAAKQEVTAQDIQLEFAPVQTENNPVEVGSIPMASLNFLSTPTSLNDEITVIKSAEKVKKHSKKGNDESTKVILMGKKFDSKPDIRYQLPVRF
jgi:hypothetical protein